MKKLSFIFISLIAAISLTATACSKQNTDTKFYDKESGVELSLPHNVTVLSKMSSEDFLSNLSDYNKLLKNTKKIVLLKVKTKYCGDIGVDAYVSENQTLNQQCLKSYPPNNDVNYDDEFFDKNGNIIPHQISIDHKPFIYLSGADGAAGNVYQVSIYRGLVNNKCVLFNVYSHTPEPSLCAEMVWPSIDVDNPKFDKLVKRADTQMSKEYDLANEIVRNAKFNTSAVSKDVK